MTDSNRPVVAIIGGSGLYELEGLRDVREQTVETPFGAPSDAVVEGELDGVRMLFLPRHGRGHRFSPTEVPYRANIWALKRLGATHLISVSAVGSMKEDIAPGYIVVVDQFVDRTLNRARTFFEGGVVAHVVFADPVCGGLASHVASSARAVGATVHEGGAYVCIEGPQFSTRAESELFRSWGMTVVGMTNVPEARLAREAEICFTTMALVTDYDCWHEHHDDVSVEAVIAVIKHNVELARQIVRHAATTLPYDDCACRHALQHAIMTAPDRIPQDARLRLGLLVDKYLAPRDGGQA